MSLQTRLVSNLYRRARSCSEAGYPASLQHLYLHKKILPLQTVQSCYRKLCIVVTEIGALLLPKSEHSRLPKSVHLSLPFTIALESEPNRHHPSTHIPTAVHRRSLLPDSPYSCDMSREPAVHSPPRAGFLGTFPHRISTAVLRPYTGS